MFGWLVATAFPAGADATISANCEQWGVTLSGYPEAARGAVSSVSISDGMTVESGTLFSSSFSIRQNWSGIDDLQTLEVEVFSNSDPDGSYGLTFVGTYHAEDCLPDLTASATCDGWTIDVTGYKPPGTRLTITADGVIVMDDPPPVTSESFTQSDSWPIPEGTHLVEALVFSEQPMQSFPTRSESGGVFDCPGATTTTTATPTTAAASTTTTTTAFDSSAPTTTDASVAGDQVLDTSEASSSTTLVASATTVDLSSEQSPSDAPGSMATDFSPGPPSSTNPIVLVLAAIGLVSIGVAGGVLLVKRLRK